MYDITGVREKDTGMCILERKASRKILRGEISFVVLFSYEIMYMHVNIYVTNL